VAGASIAECSWGEDVRDKMQGWGCAMAGWALMHVLRDCPDDLGQDEGGHWPPSVCGSFSASGPSGMRF